MRSFEIISDVPINKRDYPDLLANEARIMSEMQDSNQRIAVCVHEAAHRVYFSRIGITRLENHPSRATYLRDSDSFRYSYASVEITEYPLDRDYYLDDIAKAYVAGDAAKRAFANFPDAKVSDAYDKEKFLRDAPAAYPQVTGDQLEQYWQNAIVAVEQELKNPLLEHETWCHAFDFELWLLGND